MVFVPVLSSPLSSSSSEVCNMRLRWEMYEVAKRKVSNLDNFVSGGTQGKVSFRRPNALLKTRIRVRSRALAAPLGKNVHDFYYHGLKSVGHSKGK